MEPTWILLLRHFLKIGKHADAKFDKLSGGERRLTEVFIIVCSSAEIILLDEPFTHLSPLYIEKITELLQKEKQKKAIIVTDHMYRYILNLADNIYLIKNNCSMLIRDREELEEHNYITADSF
ncbi:hypothetical protein RM553_17315 [Zunongwangia sp. F363]|uniref:ABC transporter domain-containing protein n=1 Tax=Autumnicola tepida TaxID=3075595 RepID=A0ABU3CE28_9FLAO|nr:hypothetical protein [Zunongwangia sp. F363]MDT0644602.1 hypothetical protein [Zunongwangia sp. F363]